MYDEIYIHNNIELPDFPEDQCRYFQTKSFESEMIKYFITEEGELIREVCHYEEVPEEERPYYTDPEFEINPIVKYCGSIKKIVDSMEIIKLHGIITFYTYNKGREWLEYEAKFTNGKLQEVIKK